MKADFFIKVALGIRENPKIDRVGLAGLGAHICAIAYCKERGTDGLFAKQIVFRFGIFGAESVTLPKQMVEANLWHEAIHSCPRCPTVPEGFYYIHDYTEHQVTEPMVEVLRAKRMEAGRRGGKRSGEARRSKNEANASTKREANHEPNRSTKPEANTNQTETETETETKNKTLLQISKPAIVPSNGSLSVARKPDLIWEAMLEACGIDPSAKLSNSARGAYNAAAKGLRDRGASPDQIAVVARAYRALWPKVSLTPTALDRRWDEVIANVGHSLKPDSAQDDIEFQRWLSMRNAGHWETQP